MALADPFLATVVIGGVMTIYKPLPAPTPEELAVTNPAVDPAGTADLDRRRRPCRRRPRRPARPGTPPAVAATAGAPADAAAEPSAADPAVGGGADADADAAADDFGMDLGDLEDLPPVDLAATDPAAPDPAAPEPRRARRPRRGRSGRLRRQLTRPRTAAVPPPPAPPRRSSAMKFSLDAVKGTDWKQFGIDHGEKIGLGAAALAVGAMLFFGRWTPYTATNPAGVENDVARQARLLSESRLMPDRLKADAPDFDVASRARAVLKDLPVDEASLVVPINAPLYPLQAPNGEPTWLPVETLVADAVTLPVRLIDEGAVTVADAATDGTDPDDKEPGDDFGEFALPGAGAGAGRSARGRGRPVRGPLRQPLRRVRRGRRRLRARAARGRARSAAPWTGRTPAATRTTPTAAAATVPPPPTRTPAAKG